MDKLELRHGNIVMIKGSFRNGTIKSFYESGIHIGYGKTYKFSELEGICIDPVWLQRLGFEYNPESDSMIIKKGKMKIEIVENKNCYELIFNDSVQYSVEKVHEIQNMAYVLCKIELPVKDVSA